MKSNYGPAGFLIVFAVVMLLACGNQMEPAKNALDNISVTLKSVATDAQKYVPDQYADAQSKAAALQASYDKKDYAAVVAGAPALLTEINGLGTAAAAKKDEILKAEGAAWRKLSVSIPQEITAVQGKVDALSKTKRAPPGVDMATAKSGLADASASWAKAQEAFKSGNPADAVAAAKDAQGKLESAAAALKLNLTTPS